MRTRLPKVTDYLALLEEAWQAHLASKAVDAPTVISTFAGCGGSSLGYSMAGYHELLAVEWDQNAIETFRLNFPSVPFYHGDISMLSVDEVLERTKLQPGLLDVLDGSPPCQGFSTAGKRQYYDGRNQLFREYVRLLRGLKPKAFVMENVSGLIKGSMKLIFVEILKELKASGYRVSARLMNAKFFGVPQNRERVIFIGVRDGDPSHPSAAMQPVSFRQAVSGLSLTQQDAVIAHVWIDEVKRQTKWIEAASRLHQGQSLVPGVPSSIRAFWDRPLPTIQKNAISGQPPYVRNSTIHPSEPRTLSTREMARGQSFPDGFRFIDPLHHGMQRIGNSVPPLFMRSIAEHLKSAVLDRQIQQTV